MHTCKHDILADHYLEHLALKSSRFDKAFPQDRRVHIHDYLNQFVVSRINNQSILVHTCTGMVHGAA